MSRYNAADDVSQVKKNRTAAELKYPDIYRQESSDPTSLNARFDYQMNEKEFIISSDFGYK